MSEGEGRKVLIGALMLIGGIILGVLVMFMDNPKPFTESIIGRFYILAAALLVVGAPVVMFKAFDD